MPRSDMKLISVVLCLASLAVVVTDCAQQYDDPAIEALVQEELKKIGDIDLRGVILSESGDPLLDVSVDYVVRKYGDVVAQVPEKTHSMSVDGSFRLRMKEISSISMSITKYGYYSVSWGYNFSSDTPRQNPGGYEIVDVEFVLTKRPEPAPLDEVEGFLRSSTKEPISVLLTSKTKIPPVMLYGAEREAWKARKASGPNLYLEGMTDENGRFAVVEFKLRGQNNTIDGLSLGWIKHSDPVPGDGFVIFDPGEVPIRHNLVFREMNEAPIDGYYPWIELSTSGGPEIVYFYCRIAGHYGKGLVTGRPTVNKEEDEQVVIAKIIIFLNRTGSRNVAYIHY